MTPVYSGGLVYEYSEEGSNFGLVTISGSDVTETVDFTSLQSKLAATVPSGDGGYNSTSQAATCPSISDTWQVTEFTGELLPAIPSDAVAYMSRGAGTGPGLAGKGSQNAGGQSYGTASAGSGTVTATATGTAGTASSTASMGAVSSLSMGEASMAPYVCAAIVAFGTLFGAAMS